MRLGLFSFAVEGKAEGREHGTQNVKYAVCPPPPPKTTVASSRPQALFVLIHLLHQSRVSSTATGEDTDYGSAVQHPVLPEAIKFALAVAYLLWQRRRRSHVYAPVREDSLPLGGLSPDTRRSSDVPLNGHAVAVSQAHSVPRIPPSLAFALIFLAGVVFTYQKYNVRNNCLVICVYPLRPSLRCCRIRS